MDGTTIKRRLAVLESERTNIESVWDLIEQFVVPFRGSFYNDEKNENSVDWRERDVFDSTAIMANQTLASSIHGSLTSPSFRWFDLRFRTDEYNTKQEFKEWLEECAKRVYYALQDSNFNLEANELYTDLASIGTSIVVEELEGDEMGKEQQLVFSTIPPKECFFEEDHHGKICYFYRKLSWTPVQIKEKFGDKTPSDIMEMVTKPDKASTKLDIIFCIYKRLGPKLDTSKILALDARPYGFKYILAKTCEQLGDTGGYYDMPAFVPRWRRSSSSKFGHSPAMIALPDILTVNQLVELTLRSLEKVVDPATLVTERGLLSDLDLQAGGLTVLRSLDDMKTHESRARFDVANLHHDKLRASIRSAFYVDQLELKESPAMTATEVQVRYELMQRLLGPTLGRLQSDFLSPMIERTFMILYRSGKLPQIPEGLDATDLDIQYTGPLTSAQKVDQAAKVERWLNNMARIAEIRPDVLDIVDVDAVARDLADVLSVPAKYVRDETKVTTARKQRQHQEQIAQEMAMAEQASIVAKNMGGMGGKQ